MQTLVIYAIFKILSMYVAFFFKYKKLQMVTTKIKLIKTNILVFNKNIVVDPNIYFHKKKNIYISENSAFLQYQQGMVVKHERISFFFFIEK